MSSYRAGSDNGAGAATALAQNRSMLAFFPTVIFIFAVRLVMISIKKEVITNEI